MSLWLKNKSGGTLNNGDLHIHLPNGVIANGATTDILLYEDNIHLMVSHQLREYITNGDVIFTETNGGTEYSIDESLRIVTPGAKLRVKDDHVYDDLRVPVSSAATNGLPPTWGSFKNDGSGTTNAQAVEFIGGGTAAEMSIPNDASYNISGSGNNGTFEMWFFIPNNAPDDITIVRRDTSWGVWTNASNQLTFWLHQIGQITPTQTFSRGQWQHLCLTFVTIPNLMRARLYLNGNQIGIHQQPVGIATSTNPIRINYTHDGFSIDNVAWWGDGLTAQEVDDQWNGGAGVELVGNETDLVSYWDLNHTSGTVATDSGPLSNDASLLTTEDTDFSWVAGHVGAVASSTGVYLRYFSAAETNEVIFEVQFEHGWKEGSDIGPHVHWVPTESGGVGDRVRWGLEYTWSNVGDVFGDTTIIYANDNNLSEDVLVDKSYVSAFQDVSGTGKKISSIIVGRLFRDATHVDDDYEGMAGMLFFDIHIEKDADGSTQKWIK